MRVPIFRFATIVTCLVLCSAPYQVQADSSDHFSGYILTSGTFTSIDVPGASLTQTFGINASGQIVGYNSVPEPSSLLFLGVGLVALAAWRWKHAT